MGINQEKWQDKKCHVRDGIFFGSDEYVSLKGLPELGYSAGERRPISELQVSIPDGWCDLNETVIREHASDDLSVYAGETSWEGEGFVAVTIRSTDQLIWLLHLSESEPFSEIKIDGDILHAISGGYPDRFEWNIPISAPETLSVFRI